MGNSAGKFLIILGVTFIILGVAFIIFSKFKLPFLGRLPGDIVIEKKNFTFYFPLTTCIILVLFLVLLFIFSLKNSDV